MHTPGRGEGALRRFRVSVPEASYFITLCSEQRTDSLVREEIAPAIRAELSAIEADGHWLQRAGVIMPDHLHLFVCLTGRLPLARCIARLKSKTRDALLAAGLCWQPNFYEHRLRASDSAEDVVRYLFLNPYRAGVISTAANYRWFWLGAEDATWFTPGTDDGKPIPEWLR